MTKVDSVKVRRLIIYRWLVWGVLALAFIIVHFQRQAVGVIKNDLVMEFNISKTTFANLGSMYFYAYMVMQIPSGMLADSLGARKTVTIGTMMSGIGSIIFGFAPTIAIAFLGRLLIGLGISVVFISILKIQSKWFKESEFGTISGITAFIGNMGGSFAQTPLALMVAAITWRYSFAMVGVFTMIISPLCYLIVRNTPTEMNLPSIEEIEGKKIINRSTEKPNLIKGLIKVVSNRNTWPIFVVFCGFNGASISMTGTWGVSYVSDVYGISRASASNYIAATLIGIAIGSVVIGKISDKIKKRKLPMLIFGSVYVICWGIIVFVNGGKPPIGILMPLLFILGFANSAFVLGWACAKEVNPQQIAGTSTAVVNTGLSFGAVVVPPLLGKVFDSLGNSLPPVQLYSKAFFYCFISVLIGFIFVFFIKETNCTNIYKVELDLQNSNIKTY